jgi:hypothetical protein
VFSIECVLYRKVHANQTVNMQIVSNCDLAAALERNAEDVDAAWVDLCERGAVPGIRVCMYLCMDIIHTCSHTLHTCIHTHTHTYV